MNGKECSFTWNPRKEAINVKKHGINFRMAEKAFDDKDRKIYTDAKHSIKEARYFCLGRVGDQIITVRFTYRGKTIRIIGAGYWRKGRQYYYEEDC